MTKLNFTLSDFDYYLPPQLIANQPLTQRNHSRLMVVQPPVVKPLVEMPQLQHRQFFELPQLLRRGDLLVLNNSKVLKARLFGHKPSGGKVEIMLERVVNDQELIAHLRTSKTIKLGMEIMLPGEVQANVCERLDNIFRLRLNRPLAIYDYLEQYGSLPLPPYMEREANLDDDERYQTVYAKQQGSVAAPTAGLHFTTQLLEQLQQAGIGLSYVTLHVGSGTFKPVSSENIHAHKMHSERYSIDQHTIEQIMTTKANGGKVIAVGTTSLRTLETAAERGLSPHSGETDIFITPGFKFRVVDRLITNFHLPKSTLLMLVSAFSGYTTINQAYQAAIANNYRFFSYGDAMLLSRQEPL